MFLTYGSAAGLDTCFHTGYGLAWSTACGSVSMLQAEGSVNLSHLSPKFGHSSRKGRSGCFSTVEWSTNRLLEPATNRLLEPATNRLLEPATNRLLEPAINRLLEPATNRLLEPAINRLQIRLVTNWAILLCCMSYEDHHHQIKEFTCKNEKL